MMQDLLDQTKQYLENQPPTPRMSPHPAAFNVYSHNTPILENGYNEEEWKVIQETRKILNMPQLAIHATCVRVPVLRAHSESVLIEFESKPPSLEEIKEIFVSKIILLYLHPLTVREFFLRLKSLAISCHFCSSLIGGQFTNALAKKF